MADNINHRHVRAGRDRVIDLLGFGQTYPIQDPIVDDHGLTVAIDESADIPVDPAQVDAGYTLFSRDEQVVEGTSEVLGTGGRTGIRTPPVNEDITFKILARKLDTDRRDWLHSTATIKVGLDTSLATRILAPPLVPVVAPPDHAPRIVDFGATVEVQIDDAQEGVGYRLVTLADGIELPLSDDQVMGLGAGHSILLRSTAVSEDLQVHVRATKTFDPLDGREPQSKLLDADLPLAVRADPRSTVTAAESIVAFAGSTEILLSGTQASARYRLWARTLGDEDLDYHGTVAPALIVEVEGRDDVRVPAPNPDLGATPEDYRALGPWQPGHQDGPGLDTGPLNDDTLLIVQASKQHGAFGASTVQLSTAAVVLVAPDQSIDLALAIPVTATTMIGPVGLMHGAPGVFYTLRRGVTGRDREPPAYFHRLDPSDPRQNRGVGLMRIEGDFSLARDLDREDPAAEPALFRPSSPVLAFGRETLEFQLHVRATKARTGVSAELDRVATIQAPPAIRAAQPELEAGTLARLVVAGRAGERYEPFLDGTSIGAPEDGQGQDLIFTTGPVTENTIFEVHIRKPTGAGLPVTRIVRIAVKVH